jgi:hypothetical protein
MAAHRDPSYMTVTLNMADTTDGFPVPRIFPILFLSYNQPVTLVESAGRFRHVSCGINSTEHSHYRAIAGCPNEQSERISRLNYEAVS